MSQEGGEAFKDDQQGAPGPSTKEEGKGSSKKEVIFNPTMIKILQMNFTTGPKEPNPSGSASGVAAAPVSSEETSNQETEKKTSNELEQNRDCERSVPPTDEPETKQTSSTKDCQKELVLEDMEDKGRERNSVDVDERKGSKPGKAQKEKEVGAREKSQEETDEETGSNGRQEAGIAGNENSAHEESDDDDPFKSAFSSGESKSQSSHSSLEIPPKDLPRQSSSQRSESDELEDEETKEEKKQQKVNASRRKEHVQAERRRAKELGLSLPQGTSYRSSKKGKASKNDESLVEQPTTSSTKSRRGRLGLSLHGRSLKAATDQTIDSTGRRGKKWRPPGLEVDNSDTTKRSTKKRSRSSTVVEAAPELITIVEEEEEQDENVHRSNSKTGPGNSEEIPNSSSEEGINLPMGKVNKKRAQKGHRGDGNNPKQETASQKPGKGRKRNLSPDHDEEASEEMKKGRQHKSAKVGKQGSSRSTKRRAVLENEESDERGAAPTAEGLGAIADRESQGGTQTSALWKMTLLANGAMQFDPFEENQSADIQESQERFRLPEVVTTAFEYLTPRGRRIVVPAGCVLVQK